MHNNKGEFKLSKKVWEIPELNELGVRYTEASSNLSTSFRKSKTRKKPGKPDKPNHSSDSSSSSDDRPNCGGGNHKPNCGHKK